MRRILQLMGQLGLLAVLLAAIIPARAQPAGAPATREVTYTGAGGVTLAGTLVLPDHAAGARLPGVLIVPGGGATGRDGAGQLYSQIADALAQAGIASLRYDKRGVGASAAAPGDLAAGLAFRAWDNYVADAAAGFRYLQQQPEIDPARTALLGHSEGAYLSEQIATTQAPAALVLISGPGRPYALVIREQIATALQQARATAGVTAFALGQYDALVAGITQDGRVPAAAVAALQQNSQVPAAITQLIVSIFPPNSGVFWQGAFQVNPPALLEQYPGPALVVQGAQDTQVSATADAPALDAALARRAPDTHETMLVPNASHFMKRVQDPATSSGESGPLLPEVAGKLGAWLAAHLAPSSAAPAPAMPRTGQGDQGPVLLALLGGAALLLLLARRLRRSIAI